MDEHEHEATKADWEIVPQDEASLEDYPFRQVSRCWCLGADCMGEENLPADEFCFQAKQKPTPARDGGLDAKARPPR